MGLSDNPDVAQSRSYDQSVFTQTKRSPDFRRAVVYLVVNSDPKVWRVRAEKSQEHINAGSHGWFGGRVLWGHDHATREDAETIALAWVADGVLPHSA